MDGSTAARALEAGAAATGVMTAITYIAPCVGMPTLKESHLVGQRLCGSEAAPGSRAWCEGMGFYWINGAVISPLAYALFGERRLPGPSWARGMLWGSALWVATQAGLMPAVGKGFFCAKETRRWLAVAGNLVEHLAYGAVLGAVVECSKDV